MRLEVGLFLSFEFFETVRFLIRIARFHFEVWLFEFLAKSQLQDREIIQQDPSAQLIIPLLFYVCFL